MSDKIYSDDSQMYSSSWLCTAIKVTSTCSDLPVKEILEKENIFVMDESRASHQDIRPIQFLILNLMPLKEETELQLLRSLSNTPLQSAE